MRLFQFIQNSKIKFDFNKYDCLFGLSGTNCDCTKNENVDEFQVSFNVN